MGSTSDGAAPARLIAPWWHTTLLIVIMLAASAGQANRLGAMVQIQGRLLLYATTIGVEWILVGFIWIAVRRRGLKLRDLIGGRWNSPEDGMLDVAIAAGFWIASLLILAA